MKLYLISQDINNNYDTFDSHVVSAVDKNDAKTVFPLDKEDEVFNQKWVRNVDAIKVKYLGQTRLKRGVILSSFNAG